MENRGQRAKQGDETRAKISAAINTFYETHGHSPSIREIAKMTGIKSTSTVHRHLKVMMVEDKDPVMKPLVEERKRGEASRKKILIAISTHYEKNGFSPTVRELSAMTGLKSTATVHQHLIVLRKLGKIDWNSTLPRTIKVLQ